MTDPGEAGLVTGLALLLGGLVVAIGGWLGLREKLRRNSFLGIRLPSTMRSDAAWRAAHVAGGPLTIASGIMMAGGGLLVLWRPDSETLGLVILGISALVLVAGASIGVRAANAEPDD